jgi:methyl-accepting chemotaxis protein
MEEKTARERGSAEAERRAHDQTNEEQREQTQDAVAVLSEALEHLARGDLTFRVHKSLKGTYDQLRTNFNRSAEKLQATMNKVCTNMEAIHVGTRELSSASNDLSQRTEQQATNLQETATALDLITIAIKKAAMGSAHARTVVSSATAQAQEGEGIVRAAIQAMHGIESTSKEIGQILGSIDEIAFQTNLLALNAGVEAARAGDSGRGFAVVAAEVRALAQRSSEAAKEIKSLMSTSARNIGHGVDLVGKAGVALEQIRDQVANINVVVTEIAAGAQQQSASLQEVNTAVSQMDRSTKLNATMVQESSAASHAIAEETDELVSLIGSFVLSGQEENSTPRSARHRMA